VGLESVRRRIARPDNLPAHHHQLFPQNCDLHILGIRGRAKALQTQNTPDDQERHRADHDDKQADSTPSPLVRAVTRGTF
jgi:hypothetical protein